MSTAAPPRHRPLGTLLGVPSIGDVQAPRWIARRPRWVVAGVVLIGLLAISTLLRTRQLGGQLWWGEAVATGTASESFGGVLHAAYVGGSAPLYYLLLHLWVQAAGTSASATHSLSLLCALLTIPVGGWAGWSLAGPRAGFYGAVVFAFSAVGTQYAEETQPYALIVLLSLVALTAFLHAFVHRRRGYRWLFGAALAAALYAGDSAAFLAFGLLVGLAVVVHCAAPEARRGLLRDGALGFGLAAVLFVPWMPATVHQIAHATFPWHYTPQVGADIPGDQVGGERIDATLAVVAVMALTPLLADRGRRRSPEAVALWVLVWVSVSAFVLGALGELAAPVYIARYFAVLVPALLLLAALAAARTRAVGFAAIVLYVAFCADPSTFAAGHKSDVRALNGALGPALHRGDVVAVAQPEQTPLVWHYLPAGLRFATPLGPVSDPRYMDWDGAYGGLRRASATGTLAPLVASLRPGQQLLFVRPLTEGARNWKSSWARLVRRRAAQWGQLLTRDVARGILTPVGTAPDNYPGSCCVADSAVLYRKGSP